MLIKYRPVLLILLLALVLRLISIATHPLWYDEAFAVLFAEKGVSAMIYGTLAPVQGGAADIHPLLYYTTLNVWMSIFGQSPISVRLWSVLLGLLTIVFVYRIGANLFDERVGLAGALVTAIAPFHVQYSQEVRMYSLLGLLLMATTWAFLRAWRAEGNQRWRWWLIFGVLAGLAMHTQQLAAFYLVAIGLVPFIARRKSEIIGVIGGAIVALIVYLPWLVNIPGQLQKVNSYYWIAPPDGLKLLITLRSFLGVNLDIPPSAGIIALMGAIFLLLFLLIQVVMYVRKPRKAMDSDKYPIYFVLWLFVAPILLMWIVSQVQAVYLERSLLPSAVMLYIALGWMFTRSGLPRPIAAVLALIGIGLSAMGLYYQYTWNTFPNSPFGDATEFIRAHEQDGDVLLHMNKLSALPMVYYGRDLTQRYVQDVPGSSEDTLALPTQETLKLPADECIASAARGGKRFWFVVFDRLAKEYENVGRKDLVNAFAWLDTYFQLEDEFNFNDLTIYLYTDGLTRSAQC